MNPQFPNHSFMLRQQITLSSNATPKSIYMERLIFAMVIKPILLFPSKHCNAQASCKDTVSLYISITPKDGNNYKLYDKTLLRFLFLYVSVYPTDRNVN